MSRKSSVASMVAQLSEEEIALYRKNFELFDKDHDGVITLQEVKVVIRSLGAELSESELHAMLDEFDIDKNGTVDFPEFLAMMSKRKDPDGDQDLRDAFKVFDVSGTGRISAADLRVAMPALTGEPLTAEEADALVRDADTNGDGLIDYNEFVENLYRRGKKK